MTQDSGFYFNQGATSYIYQADTDVSPKSFHSKLPDFQPTPLIHVPTSFFDWSNIYIKDESERLGLPSFKILGASWGTFRSIAKAFDLPLDADLRMVRTVAQKHKAHLVTATDGNHGRAIAHMAWLLGIQATVFVPNSVNDYTRSLIRSEGATVLVEFGDYDAAVATAYKYANEFRNHFFVQDTSFEGYHEIPAWIVQGYTTMFQEVEEQLNDLGLQPTHVLTPVGVGSLAHAVVAFCKSGNRAISVVAVESEVAACLQTSLRAGVNTPISTKMTIMDGINCGTVSDISWPILRSGINGAIQISDSDSHEMVQKLANAGVKAGPCGASTSAALQRLIGTPWACKELCLDKSSVVVLLNTEGPREYAVPA